MRSRILYVIGQLGMGGSERQLVSLLQALDRKRYPPAVAVWNFNPHDYYVEMIRSLGVPLYPLRAITGRMGKLFRLRRLIIRLEAEVVHSYSFFTNFPAWWGTLGTPSVSVGSVRGGFRRALEESGVFSGALSARWPRVQLYNSRSAAREVLRSARRLRPAKVIVVWNGVDLSRFIPMPAPSEPPVQIVGVGSLFAVKRWDRLLEAAATLDQEGFEFRVQIAGDGPLRGALGEAIRRMKLQRRVSLLGAVTDVPRLLARSSFLVHTAAAEGCPNVILEAMASARAVVACDVGDVPDIVEHGRTGLIVGRDDRKGLANSIRELLTRPDVRAEMGRAGRLKMEREFQLCRMVEETLGTYRAAGWREN